MDTPIPRDCSNILNVVWGSADKKGVFDNQHNYKKIKIQKLFFFKIGQRDFGSKKIEAARISGPTLTHL